MNEPAPTPPPPPIVTNARPEIPGAKKRRTGVVLAMALDSNDHDLAVMLAGLTADYPGVKFTIVAGAMSSVVFEYDG